MLSTSLAAEATAAVAAGGNYTSYSTYWRTIDVEGIGVDDGFGYTVTITAANLADTARKRSCLRDCLHRLIFPPYDDPDFPERQGANTHRSKVAFPQQAHHRSRGNVPMWGLRGFEKDPIEVIARNSLEVLEESRLENYPARERRSSDVTRDLDDSNIKLGVGWSPPPNHRAHESFFCESDVD
jgi:hypothetical protein